GWRLDEFSFFAPPPHGGASAHARPDERHSVPMDARRPPICLRADACVVGAAVERAAEFLPRASLELIALSNGRFSRVFAYTSCVEAAKIRHDTRALS